MEDSELKAKIIEALAGVTERPYEVEIDFHDFTRDPFIRVDMLGTDMHWSPNVDVADFLSPIDLPREDIEADPAKFLAGIRDDFAAAVLTL